MSQQNAYRLVARADRALGVVARTGKDFVTSVLKYFEGMERAARLANERAEYQHFENCWLTVHRAFYGRFKYPAVPLTASASSLLCNSAEREERKSAKWFTDIYSRPMRAVWDISTVKGKTVLMLSCGHKLDSFDPNDARKHARCKQCKGLKRK